MKWTKPKIIEVDMQRIDQLIDRLEQVDLSAEDRETIENILQAYVQLLGMLQDKNTSLKRLKKLLFGAKTERLEKILENTDADGKPGQEGAEEGNEASAEASTQRPRPHGHGRHAAEDYTGAEQVLVQHPTLQPGDPCPKCHKGTVYNWPNPGVLVRLTGQPPIRATVYRLEKLRCNLCGAIFTAPTPQGIGAAKYDATTISTIALLKYGTGLPFNRLQRLEANYGIPFPASSQWEAVRDGALQLVVVHHELIRQAGQGDVLYNDDTTVKIIQLMLENAQQDPSRRGMFTTGIVALGNGHKIALFFSGRQHAGENLGDVLRDRAAALGPPIQMCDALSRNVPQELQTILANCLAHGRRKFADVIDAFPADCRYVLEALSQVYRVDAEAKQDALSPQERLQLHQTKSAPVMDALKTWFDRQFDEHLVEPNSGLGQAIQYMKNHWEALTLFLREPGAPLDNNVAERALKKSILHRRNSLFYKTQNGADVGDIYMSLIYTCELNEVNPADYLTELLRHTEQLTANPAGWLPWTYRQTLQPATTEHAVS